MFKKHDLPVIYVQHINEKNGVIPGSVAFEMLDQLIPNEEDPIIYKTYGNAFNKTNLKKLVDESGINTWLLAGYRAENCILSTYRGALDLDLTPILLKNAVAGPIKENVAFVESISESITLGALKQVLQ
jgi:nicotinamidase-related amidase